MTRGIAFALLGALAFAGGCASPARIVSFNPADGSGVVAVPDSSNSFPFYYKDKASALIQDKVGPNFILGPATEVATTQGKPETDAQQSQNRNNPNMPGDKPKSATECQYSFRRGPAPVGSALTSTGVTSGVTTTGMTTAGGAGQLPPGVVPSVLPAGGVQPVSGTPQRGSNNW
ncbi:hypothetical protein [Frigoriglobus tundricola]|uniref:Lipoprotein n=1 Tax=Frigoriglobus tundricola TaxID=2774151 RepID=A0A6M5YSN4_9BACT|nr:hypothetical protein [Frigoriglobus tundricola]QJW97077.1 hypothetical protein FTUN_4642 [Frigoriglobus tundricola]